MFRRICFAVMCVGLLAITPNASAALGPELVVNGNFETGDTTGWTIGVDPVTGVPRGRVQVVKGNNALVLDGTLGYPPNATQTVSVDPSETYQLSFTMSNVDDAVNYWPITAGMRVWQDSPKLDDLVAAGTKYHLIEIDVTFGPAGSGADYVIDAGTTGLWLDFWGNMVLRDDCKGVVDNVSLRQVVTDSEAIVLGVEAIEAKLDAGVGGGGDPVDLTVIEVKLDALEAKADFDSAAIELAIAALEIKADLDRGALDALTNAVSALETKLDTIDELLRTPQGQRNRWND